MASGLSLGIGAAAGFSCWGCEPRFGRVGRLFTVKTFEPATQLKPSVLVLFFFERPKAYQVPSYDFGGRSGAIPLAGMQSL